MNELTEKMNFLLKEIDTKRWISLSKDSDDLTFKAKDKLRAFGLIERHGQLSWQLIEEGYKAIELGGFEEWNNSRDMNKVDVYTTVLLALKSHSTSGDFIDITKEELGIDLKNLKGICKMLEKENKLEIKPNGEYHVGEFNNVTGKILARIRPEGLNYLNQHQSSVNIGNVSFITGDKNNVNQARIENSKNSKPKQIIQSKSNESKHGSVKLFLEKFWWTFVIPLIIILISLLIEYNWFTN